MGLDLLTVEVSRSLSNTPHSVGHLWTSDRSVTNSSTLTTHTPLTRDRNPCSRRGSNPQSQQASGRRPTTRPRGQRDWRIRVYSHLSIQYFKSRSYWHACSFKWHEYEKKGDTKIACSYFWQLSLLCGCSTYHITQNFLNRCLFTVVLCYVSLKPVTVHRLTAQVWRGLFCNQEVYTIRDIQTMELFTSALSASRIEETCTIRIILFIISNTKSTQDNKVLP